MTRNAKDFARAGVAVHIPYAYDPKTGLVTNIRQPFESPLPDTHSILFFADPAPPALHFSVIFPERYEGAKPTSPKKCKVNFLRNTDEDSMRTSFVRDPKWWLFSSLLGAHIFLTWKAFQFNWLLLEEVAIWPVVILESVGINLSSCYEFICLPSAAGWMACLFAWSGIHYLAAVVLSRLGMRNG